MGTRRKPSAEDGREFFRRLGAEGLWSPVFLISGEERFLVDEAVRRLVAAAFPDGRDDFNYHAFHGSEASGTDIASAAAQVPMFAARRVVVVRGLDKLSQSDLDAVADYVERPYDSCMLVLEALKLDARLKPVKRLLGAGGVAAVEFGGMYERDAAQWVGRQAQRRGLQLAPDVAPYLVEALGTSLGPLDMAIERLDIYVGGARSVTLDDARTLVPDTRARSVFELTDHLASREFTASVACFHRMVDQGESPIGALAMIARHFRQLVAARDGLERGLPERELAAAIGCPPFRVRDYKDAAGRFDDRRLRAIIRAVAETDMALKSSRVRRELIVERLFVRICDGTAI